MNLKETRASLIVDEQDGKFRVCYHYPEDDACEIGASVGYSLPQSGVQIFQDPCILQGRVVGQVCRVVRGKAIDKDKDASEDMVMCASLEKAVEYIGYDMEGIYFCYLTHARKALLVMARALYDFRAGLPLDLDTPTEDMSWVPTALALGWTPPDGWSK